MKAILLARFTLREALRKRAVLAAIILGLGFLALFAFGSYFAIRELNASTRILPSVRPVILAIWVLMGLWVVNLMGSLLAIFISAGSIGGEIDSHTLDLIVSKPVRRAEIVVGKWLGYAPMAILYTVVLSSAVIGIMFFLGDYLPPHPWFGLPLMALGVVVLVSLSILGSTVLPTMANGIAVFMLYAVGVMAGTIQQVGFLLKDATMEQIGTIVGWVIPSDLVWRMAAYQMQPGMASFAQMGGPFGAVAPPNPWMTVYAVLYALAALSLAVYLFGQRDL